jgi:hypothetical protein
MVKGKTRFLWIGVFSFWLWGAHAQSPQQVVQQVVDTERAANKNDNHHWVYLEELRKPKEHVLQWVAGTEQGNVRRILEKDGEGLPESQQRDLIQRFQRDSRAQRKEISENDHDNQQIDDFLKLLPTAFVWTQTGVTVTDTTLHFEPAPSFHPPTRESRVFSSMTGYLIIDNQQHRIRSMSGHLIHDVVFGGGILGRLKENSSFSLEQAQVAQDLWELTAIHVHLEGNALLFKSVSLQQDDERSRFELAPPSVTLDQAAALVLSQPEVAQLERAGLKVSQR